MFFIHHGGAADGKRNTLKEESEPWAADGSEESAAGATSDRQRSDWHAVARSDQRPTDGERENGKPTTSTRSRIGGRNPGTSPTASGFTFCDPPMMASSGTRRRSDFFPKALRSNRHIIHDDGAFLVSGDHFRPCKSLALHRFPIATATPRGIRSCFSGGRAVSYARRSAYGHCFLDGARRKHHRSHRAVIACSTALRSNRQGQLFSLPSFFLGRPPSVTPINATAPYEEVASA